MVLRRHVHVPRTQRRPLPPIGLQFALLPARGRRLAPSARRARRLASPDRRAVPLSRPTFGTLAGSRAGRAIRAAGRGIARLTSDARAGRCPSCGRAQPRRADRLLIAHHDTDGRRCDGTGQPPADDATLASWLPVLPRLTPHGLRHSHQTWMEEDRISDLLRSERMGHEVAGMRGVYGHVSYAMRADLTAALQERWDIALRDRSRHGLNSAVPALDALLAPHRAAATKIGSHLAPKIGHSRPTEAG